MVNAKQRTKIKTFPIRTDLRKENTHTIYEGHSESFDTSSLQQKFGRKEKKENRTFHEKKIQCFTHKCEKNIEIHLTSFRDI